jgi:phosphopantetheinyl transferase (holo-ACP synthase)
MRAAARHDLTMIGNDVVDLADPDVTGGDRHPRFDTRVFAPSERAMLAASADGERLRWRLWAAKESAYKAARRCDPRVVFSPARFVVEPIDDASATVTVDERCLRVVFTRVARAPGCVHAVAAAFDPLRVCAGVAPLTPSDTPSLAARELAITAVASVLRVSPDVLTIRREGRVPTLWRRDRRHALALSLSHHGRFVAFACALDREQAA